MSATTCDSPGSLATLPFAEWTAYACFTALTPSRQWLSEALLFEVDDFRLCVMTDMPGLLQRLATYFRHCSRIVALDNVPGGARLVHVLEAPALKDTPAAARLGIVPEAFVDWIPEPGKTRRKDAIIDLADGRLIHKVRTGMAFLRSNNHNLAFGPCEDNESQVINFLLNLHMSHLQQNDGLICHASALSKGDRAVAIAAFSGGGKSTTMVKALDNPEFDFISNDRLFLDRPGREGTLRARGVAKLPRINPGTMLNNPRLRTLLDPARIAGYEAMPQEALWDLEEKHDLIIEDVYGPGRIRASGELAAMVILNWTRGSEAPLEVREVEVGSNEPLIRAVMKTPGPFHQGRDGRFVPNGASLDPAPYLERLSRTRVLEVTGRVDFAALVENHLTPLLEA
ncbi:HprK-related kinase B [Cobetia sp. LC6]|uniref:HprK-related kinase B n=1 Tax=Cobetia sp. LC6 TaxID=3050947 RepID=UPI0025558574|nr:HprK-related kinase B [Cobetia sp. LC6]MDL2191870.1 HprK-related kinase B [Cobetia sp. LC6]